MLSRTCSQHQSIWIRLPYSSGGSRASISVSDTVEEQRYADGVDKATALSQTVVLLHRHDCETSSSDEI